MYISKLKGARKIIIIPKFNTLVVKIIAYDTFRFNPCHQSNEDCIREMLIKSSLKFEIKEAIVFYESFSKLLIHFV